MANGARILSLKCANCGANLQVAPDLTQFACGYCGANQVVERHGGAVHLKMLSDGIAKIQQTSEKTAAELAYKRLSEEIQEIDARLMATQANLERKRGLPIAVAIMVCLPLSSCGIISMVAGNVNGFTLSAAAVGIGISLLVYFRIKSAYNSTRPLSERLLEEKRITEQQLREKRAIIDS